MVICWRGGGGGAIFQENQWLKFGLLFCFVIFTKAENVTQTKGKLNSNLKSLVKFWFSKFISGFDMVCRMSLKPESYFIFFVWSEQLLRFIGIHKMHKEPKKSYTKLCLLCLVWTFGQNIWSLFTMNLWIYEICSDLMENINVEEDECFQYTVTAALLATFLTKKSKFIFPTKSPSQQTEDDTDEDLGTFLTYFLFLVNH